MLRRLIMLALFLGSCVFNTACIEVKGRPSDETIVPVGYVINPKGVVVYRDPLNPSQYWLKAIPASFFTKDSKPGAVRIAAYSISTETMQRLRNSGSTSETISGDFVAVVESGADGGVKDTSIRFTSQSGYLLLFVFDDAGGTKPAPTSIQVPTPSAIIAKITDSGVGVFEGLFPMPSRFIWTSSAETESLDDRQGGFNYVANRAAQDWGEPDLGDLHSAVDTYVLAGAIYYAKRKDEAMRDKVIAAIDRLVEKGMPTTGFPNIWASNLSGYVAAADIVRYQTPAFRHYLETLLDLPGYNASAGAELTIKDSWRNYGVYHSGSQALVALATVYAYLGDKAAFSDLVVRWKALVDGNLADTVGVQWPVQSPWVSQRNKPRLISPVGDSVVCTIGGQATTVSLDGFFSAQMGPGSQPCDAEPVFNIMAWRTAELQAIFLRLAKRQGFDLTDYGDRAVYRAFRALMRHAPLNLPQMGRMLWVTRLFDHEYGGTESCVYQNLEGNLVLGGGVSTSYGWGWVMGPLHLPCR